MASQSVLCAVGCWPRIEVVPRMARLLAQGLVPSFAPKPRWFFSLLGLNASLALHTGGRD